MKKSKAEMEWWGNCRNEVSSFNRGLKKAFLRWSRLIKTLKKAPWEMNARTGTACTKALRQALMCLGISEETNVSRAEWTREELISWWGSRMAVEGTEGDSLSPLLCEMGSCGRVPNRVMVWDTYSGIALADELIMVCKCSKGSWWSHVVIQGIINGGSAILDVFEGGIDRIFRQLEDKGWVYGF